MPAQWMPGFLPPEVTDKDYLENPLGSQPFPAPSGMPSPLWMGALAPLTFSTVNLPATIFARAVWRSPIFDLRPDFRGVMTGRSAGQASMPQRVDPSVGATTRAHTVKRSGVVPIWIPRGAAGKLWVQVFGIGTQNWSERGLRVIAQEYANLTDPNNMPQVTDNTNVTTEFVGAEAAALGTTGLTTRKTSSVLMFQPVGSGYPLRYWQVQITFLYIVNSAALANWPNPGYSLQSAFY